MPIQVGKAAYFRESTPQIATKTPPSVPPVHPTFTQIPYTSPMVKFKSFFQRANRAMTEVGIEHFDDDKDWDERVKLPAWQTERLRKRHAEQARKPRLGKKPTE